MIKRTSTSLNAEGAGAAAVHPPAATSLAQLVSRQVLRDGELVILLLKPSLWYILLSALRFAAVVLLAMIATRVFDDYLPPLNKLAITEAGVFLIAGRVMWAVMQWSSRLYVLTDMRIISIWGVFNASVFHCPPRKIARARLIFSARERLLRVGAVEILPPAADQPQG